MNDPAEKPKRFYASASVEKHDDLYTVLLDERIARTRGKAPLATSSPALADAIVAEWEAQGERIDVLSMPMMRLLATWLDRPDGAETAWRETCLSYLGTDLLSYRADRPDDLVHQQQAAWDPWVSWAQEKHVIRLRTTVGIMAIDQPPESRVAMASVLGRKSSEELFAQAAATELLGSAILGLALIERADEASALFIASRVDEAYQISQWGEDAEAAQRAAIHRNDLFSLDRFISLLQASDREYRSAPRSHHNQ